MNKTYTVGQLAKRFSVSRSTLLYYDSIELLIPSDRSEANYRLYSEDDVARMEKICLYREAGLPLESIAYVLDLKNNEAFSVLEMHLFTINSEIQALRQQQAMVVKMLHNEGIVKNTRVMTKERWVALLSATGLSEQDMQQWHIEFEKMSPEGHQDFLESLGIPPQEIDDIRAFSRGEMK